MMTKPLRDQFSQRYLNNLPQELLTPLRSKQPTSPDGLTKYASTEQLVPGDLYARRNCRRGNRRRRRRRRRDHTGRLQTRSCNRLCTAIVRPQEVKTLPSQLWQTSPEGQTKYASKGQFVSGDCIYAPVGIVDIAAAAAVVVADADVTRRAD